MRSLKFVIALSLIALLSSCTSYAAERGSEAEIRQVATLWIEGISLGDPDYMVELYADDAILHGTVSPVLRQGPTLIKEYFNGITDSPPTMFFVEPMNIRVYGDTAVNTGNYGVRFDGDDEAIMLRYSFVYHRAEDGWKIVDHHSSTMPE